MNSKISVITPSLNSSKYIEEAIKSVMEQGYDSYEHIIVDAGSKDGTIDILKKYAHLKWVSEPDKGQSDAINKGFAMSTGDIIVSLNADDYFEKGAFEYAKAGLANECDVIFGKVKVLLQDGGYLINDPNIKFEKMLRWWESDAYSYNASGYFYKRKVQMQIPFDITDHYCMDLKFLLEASKVFTFQKVDHIFGIFRLLADSKTGKHVSDLNHLGRIMSFCDEYVKEMDVTYAKKYFFDKDNYMSARKKEAAIEVASNTGIKKLLRFLSKSASKIRHTK